MLQPKDKDWLGEYKNKNLICAVYKRPRFHPWVGKIPWRREWLPTPVFWPGDVHGQRLLTVYSPRGCKELDMTERLSLMDWVFQSTTLFKSLYVNWDTNKWFLVIFTPQISPTQWEPIFKYFLSLLHVELCESLDHLFTLTVGNKHLNYNGNPLQYFCLENPMDRGVWWASLWGRKESDTTKPLTLLLL